jgi:hypothetical protein
MSCGDARHRCDPFNAELSLDSSNRCRWPIRATLALLAGLGVPHRTERARRVPASGSSRLFATKLLRVVCSRSLMRTHYSATPNASRATSVDLQMLHEQRVPGGQTRLLGDNPEFRPDPDVDRRRERGRL